MPDVSPQRIQRKRTKGWRMPEGAIYVGRPTVWGNPWNIGSTAWTVKPGGWIDREPHPPLTREQAIASFRNSLEYQLSDDPSHLDALRGRDLACWCPLEDADGNRVPCHADVLLELANARALTAGGAS